ncbi:hypothetical protein BT69DRAFT_25576 [Atractiella rhizophila]|nr:hypothetical protein BT69DRAFT_25576 [Atractiella rhizophila]
MDPMDDILFPGAQNHLSEISGSKGKAESGNQLDANTWPSTPSFNFKPNLLPQSFSPTEMAAIRKANQTTLLEAGNTVVIELLLRIRYLEGKIETFCRSAQLSITHHYGRTIHFFHTILTLQHSPLTPPSWYRNNHRTIQLAAI